VGNRLLVYAWHNIEGTWCFPNQSGQGRHQFRRQLDLLRRLGTVVPLTEALHDLAEGRPLPPRAVAITFDDGYRDNLDVAVPVLERLQLPATFFLVPAMLSGEIEAWWETLAWAVHRSSRTTTRWAGREVSLDGAQRRRSWFDEIAEDLKHTNRAAREEAVSELVTALAPVGPPPQRLLMDWDGAREMVRRGFTIGSHSQFHAILAQETPAEQQRDLAASRRQLEQQLSVPVEVLAYPNGRSCDFDEHTVAAAEQAGYSFALTTMSGHNRRDTPRYEIRRACAWPHHGVLGVVAATRHMVRAATADA
jgi:peptidoglycan/xylan/chitin deacetylase (PgdA/CDA1 family)